MYSSKPVLLAALALLAADQGATPTPAEGQADPGVRPTRLIDRAEVRVSRVEVDVGAVRAVHAHTDVEYHLWVPLEGRLEITIGSGSPQIATPGQAFFLERGTMHGFRNVGTTPAAVLEVFVKQTEVQATSDALEELARALALSSRASSSREPPPR